MRSSFERCTTILEPNRKNSRLKKIKKPNNWVAECSWFLDKYGRFMATKSYWILLTFSALALSPAPPPGDSSSSAALHPLRRPSPASVSRASVFTSEGFGRLGLPKNRWKQRNVHHINQRNILLGIGWNWLVRCPKSKKPHLPSSPPHQQPGRPMMIQ